MIDIVLIYQDCLKLAEEIFKRAEKVNGLGSFLINLQVKYSGVAKGEGMGGQMPVMFVPSLGAG